ncbi:efflux RND transporter periplasmic adaptor subunit [Cellvibrio sp. pealriver]|uniref:efflux RND transporter periplasmic adaptor subunit n=1 Tax=Cellvibrio sp. pealriver TaxID=1622269 RepID=UPI00066FD800|nr:efflux RND transporter periplasmic adaptor subunit [Cellvibrio sp. pealriver]
MKKLILAAIISLVIAVPVVKKTIAGNAQKTVQVEALQEQVITRSILASGNLQHQEKVQLSTEVIGKVKQIFIKEGDRINKGQLLLQIDDEAYRSATEQQQAAVRMQELRITQLQADYKNAQAQWQRQQILHTKKLIDQQTFDQTTLALANAEFQLHAGRQQLIQSQALLAQAQTNLTKTRIYSPLDGIVTTLSIKEGETAVSGTMNFAGSSLMTIANPHSLQAEVYVDEADISQIAPGQRATIIAIAQENQPISGKVDFIAETAAVAPGRSGLSFAVKIRFDENNTIKLWPGMSARAEIFVGDDAKKLAVPIQAIVYDEDKNPFVFIARNQTAERIAVTTGIADDTRQEITAQGKLRAGDHIITGPDRELRFLQNGDRIRIEQTTLAQTASVKQDQAK